jgi:hypothetical protein
MKQPLYLLLLSLLILSLPLQAQKKKSAPEAHRMSGLYLNVDAGLLIPNSKQADFYSGRPGNSNTIDRVLHSETYGTQIWSSLVDGGHISPSAIGDYSQLQVVEYPHMYYRLTYQLGVGFRYVYESGWGWLLRFDYSQLTAAGQFNLSSNNGTGVLGSRQFVTCDIFGIERRTLIDFGIAKRIPLTSLVDLEIDFGFDLNSTHVKQNGIRVVGRTYSILDIWGGYPPSSYTGTYEYLNEGRIGIGGFGSMAVSYLSKVGSIDLGYSCYYMQTKYTNYNENDAYALQHTVFLRFNVNNFKFFD